MARPDTRGMVTAELAVAILGVLFLLLSLSWGIALLGLQLRLVDTAAAVARQSARGDRAGATAARAAAPPCARISVSVAELTIVNVDCLAAPVGRGLPAVRLRAHAVAVTEPGVAP